eukprot:2123669-Pyramimonas_sp.AAC.1
MVFCPRRRQSHPLELVERELEGPLAVAPRRNDDAVLRAQLPDAGREALLQLRVAQQDGQFGRPVLVRRARAKPLAISVSASWPAM